MEEYSGLNPLLREIETALNNKAYLLAIVCTLALPDICATLEAKEPLKSKEVGNRYRLWCEGNLPKDFLKPNDLWKLRNGVIHSGKAMKTGGMYSRVLLIPENKNIKIINCDINGDYVYNVKEFCSTIIGATKKWLDKNKDNVYIKDRMKDLLQYRIGGLLPYISGIDVIA